MIKLTVMSFGIKHGYHEPVNLFYDVRGFKNPYYIDELREKCGLDEDVYEYVFSDSGAEEFFNASVRAASILIERADKLQKESFVLAYACTGGQHRSVAFAKRASLYFEKLGYETLLYNRDCEVKS